MTPYRLLVVGCLLSLQSLAQVTPRNLLGTRYPLPVLQAALIARPQWHPYPNTPEAWQPALPDSLRNQLIRAGEAVVDKPVEPLPATLMLDYVRNGNRTRYEAASFARRNALLTLALAESIEGRGRFTDALLNGVWAICEESFWGLPAHLGGQKTGSGLPNVEDRTVDLFAAETAAVLALTDYLVGPQLAKVSPLLRPRIYYETNQRLFIPLTTQPDRYGYLTPGTKVNNWNPWIMANYLTATLLLEPNETRRGQMLHQAMTGLDLYLNGLGNDGGCDEGPSYWFAAGACVFDALDLLHSATNGRVNLYGEPLIHNMASYIYKMHIANDYFVDFADADPTLKPDGLMLYRFGQRLHDDTLTQFGRWAYGKYGNALSNNGFHRQRQVQNLLIIPGLAAQPPRPTVAGIRDAWFADVQVMTARSDQGLFLAAHGGHNAESHNHNDVGDFILYAHGQPVIIDAGRGTYTANTFSAKRYTLWYTQSQFHNLPIINGQGQPDGRAYEARAVAYTKPANNQPAGATSLSMNLAAAYPPEAGITHWHRTVTLDRAKEAVVVTDAYALSKRPTSLQQVFLTVCPVDVSMPGRVGFQTQSGPGVQLIYDPKTWILAVETVPLTTIDDEGFKTKWPGQTIRRLLLTNTKLAASGKSVFTFIPTR